MIPRGRKKIPAICCLAALTILYGLSIRSSVTVSADEASKAKRTSGLSLSDLFSSLYSDTDKSKAFADPANPDKPIKVSLTGEELSSFINQYQNQLGGQGSKNGQDEDFTGQSYDNNERRKRHPNRRKILYELSVRAHYEHLLRNFAGRGNNGSPSQNKRQSSDEGRDQNGSDFAHSYAFYNSGLHAIQREIIKDADITLISSGFTYWTYKLCQKRSISQIHLDVVPITLSEEESGFNVVESSLQLPSNSIISGKIQFTVQIVHELGTYLPPSIPDYQSVVESAWGYSEEKITTTHEDIEYYIDGDSCMYTHPDSQFPKVTKRQSKVVYEDQCCQRRQGATEEFFQQDEQIMVLSVSEPAPCRYVLLACRFCPEREVNDSTRLASSPEMSDVAPFTSGDPSEFSHLLQTYLQKSPPGTDDDLIGHFPPMPPSQIEANKQLLRNMFIHAYDSYFYNAFPASELHPIACEPGEFQLVRIPALTLIDTLDTFIIMGNFTEFARSVERLRYLDSEMKREFVSKNTGKHKQRNGEEGGLFSVNQSVSLFETTIRVLGGLLSAHQMALAFMKNKVQESDVWFNGDILVGNGTIRHESLVKEDVELPPRDGASDTDDICQNLSVDDTTPPLREPSPCPPSATNGDNSQECTADLNSEDSKNSTGVGNETMPYWAYDDFLLTLAHDIGKRLLYAFATDTGIPYGTVNLLYGVPQDETTVASLAGAGTLSLEFELLSRLTGDESFGRSAKLATRALWARRSGLDLFGKHIDTKSGQWIEYLSGVGSNSDSFYEYLIKHYLLFPDDKDFWTMFVTVYTGVWESSRLGDWYVDVDMNNGLDGHVRQIFESLMAFYPGLQILLGEVIPSAKTLNSFFLVREFLGLLPERFNFVHWKTEGGGDIHPLRPELLESCYFLHLATIGLQGSQCGPCTQVGSAHHTSSWLWAADFALHTVNKLSWTPCGYATVKRVMPTTTGSIDGEFVKSNSDPQTEQKRLKISHHDEMPSYFLSETMKYLYLTFDAEDNILHKDSERQWVFTTEAHPIHHVPTPRTVVNHGGSSATIRDMSIERDHLETQMDKIRSLLRNENVKSSRSHSSTESSLSQYLESEQWAKNTPELTFVKNIQVVENNITLIKKTLDGRKGHAGGPAFRKTLLQPTMSSPQGIFASEISATNLARIHFEYHGKGSGTKLGKNCPNFHHPSLIWSRALNGHALDYLATHKSSTSDVSDKKEEVDTRMLTSLSSICFHGTDYYSDGIAFDESKSCPIEEDPAHNMNFAHKPTNTEVQRSTKDLIPGSTRYDMGGELGEFDVSSFENGDGFIVRHVNSHELLEVSILHDYQEDLSSPPHDDKMKDEAIILVKMTVPNLPHNSGKMSSSPVMKDAPSRFERSSSLSSWKSSGERWKSLSGGDIVEKGPEKVSVDNNPHRHVIVADMNAHSYTCRVSLTRRDNADSPLAEFPCSPAMFGKANMPSLVDSKGASVKGSLMAPPRDEYGCELPLDGAQYFVDDFCHVPTSPSPLVQMVERGDCSFLRKAKVNRFRNAEAIIVINSDSHELFVMSDEKPQDIESNSDCTSDDAPVSVLITKQDGDSIINVLNNEESNGNKVDAIVQLVEQDTSTLTLPYVHGSEDALRIFATNGWGVHAVRQVSSDSDSEKGTQLQLFIMQHSKK